MKTYDIRSIMDFADIPPDRIDACLADFKDAIRFFRAVKADAIERGDLDGIKGMGFEWVDDGQQGLVGFALEMEKATETESEAV